MAYNLLQEGCNVDYIPLASDSDEDDSFSRKDDENPGVPLIQSHTNGTEEAHEHVEEHEGDGADHGDVDMGRESSNGYGDDCQGSF